MAKYKLSNTAKKNLIRIHHYGVKKFGVSQADKYFESFFGYFDNTKFLNQTFVIVQRLTIIL